MDDTPVKTGSVARGMAKKLVLIYPQSQTPRPRSKGLAPLD